MELFDPNDIYEARADAESVMLDVCTVDRPGETVTDDTGHVTTTSTRVYPTPEALEAGNPGRCKAQTTVAQASTPEAGGHKFTVEKLQLHFPAASGLQVDDVATMTAAIANPDLVGLQYRIVEAVRGSYRTADRWNVEMMTS